MRSVGHLFALLGLMFIKTVVTPSNEWRHRKFLGTTETRLRRIEASGAMAIVRYQTSKLYRRGFVQLYLRIETVEEHMLDCVVEFEKVAEKLGLSRIDRLRARVGFLVHELDEVITRVDVPLISTTSMGGRSKADRLAYQMSMPVDNRHEAIAKRRAKFDKNTDKYEKWINEHVDEADLRDLWMELLKEFHYVETRLAEICFEIHALQPSVAIARAIMEGRAEPRELAQPFFRVSEPLITLEEVLDRFEEVKRRLVNWEELPQ